MSYTIAGSMEMPQGRHNTIQLALMVVLHDVAVHAYPVNHQLLQAGKESQQV